MTARSETIVSVVVKQDRNGRLQFQAIQTLKGTLKKLPAIKFNSTEKKLRDGQRGLLFLSYDKNKQPQILGHDLGFITGDKEAIRFVTGLLQVRNQGQSAVLQFLLSKLNSPSIRIRSDLMIDLQPFADKFGSLSDKNKETLRKAAVAALEYSEAVEPALAVLALLPNDAGLSALISAAHQGLAPEVLGPILTKKEAAMKTLIAALKERRASLSNKEALHIVRVLREARHPSSIAILKDTLGDKLLHLESCRALGELAAPASLKALKAVMLNSQHPNAACWAAVGLAFMGGQEAIGALEFASKNHSSEQVRSTILKLLKNPAATRSELRARCNNQSSGPSNDGPSQESEQGARKER